MRIPPDGAPRAVVMLSAAKHLPRAAMSASNGAEGATEQDPSLALRVRIRPLLPLELQDLLVERDERDRDRHVEDRRRPREHYP